MAGIYLPILHSPEDCCKVPLAIVYTSLRQIQETNNFGECSYEQLSSPIGHFSAIIGIESPDNDINDNQINYRTSHTESKEEYSLVNIGYFPLINRLFQELPFRYCHQYDFETNISTRKSYLLVDNPLRRYLEVNQLIVRTVASNYEDRITIPIIYQNPLPHSNFIRKAISKNPNLDPNLKKNSSMDYDSRREFLKNIRDNKKNEIEQLQKRVNELEVIFSFCLFIVYFYFIFISSYFFVTLKYISNYLIIISRIKSEILREIFQKLMTWQLM